MNPKLDLLFARRSVRRYADAPVDEATVQDQAARRQGVASRGQCVHMKASRGQRRQGVSAYI